MPATKPAGGLGGNSDCRSCVLVRRAAFTLGVVIRMSWWIDDDGNQVTVDPETGRVLDADDRAQS
ncbi:hypothetical protein [Amycolatopsis circi]|uniref:hypothetical protein n=1 Tax=Amycolatopsis circi TaxID=871959 RepID=UPI0013BE9119|nr:hypothetical protein [Amycolatopsis circi]